MTQVLAIARKELYAYFSSPMALIFMGVFLASVMFTFFWLDTFFARSLADVRPLFRWIPLLLIFLIAALTMRQWSEEEQSGTLEVLLTLPVHYWQFVVGKFLAVMALVALALALTFSLPLTVTVLGSLDWGPVIGGYLAALLLAAAYVAMGLFISAQTRNEIIALILTSVAGLLLYMVGTPGITEFFGERVGHLLRLISTNSRFESIQRGVIDLRDLIYYITFCALFLALNTLILDAKRWSRSAHTAPYRRAAGLATLLILANLVALNIWLAPVAVARLDLTQHREYTLSEPTRTLLATLDEPLLIRGHFSNRTHPLLAPLAPRVADMLAEYAAASNGMVQVEIVDPAQHPEIEAEAAQTYGIRPTPFQIADRHEAALVNAYFDILIRYGDQSEVLNFQDLIEVEAFRDGQMEVRFRNLEYDLTRAIQRTVYGFQNLESILSSLPYPVRITLYATESTLPVELQETVATVAEVLQDIAATASGALHFSVIDPDLPNAPVTRQDLLEAYGLQPFMLSLFSDETFYLHLLLEQELPVNDPGAAAGQTPPQLLYPTADLTPGELRTQLESGLKRFSSGFLQVVGVWLPIIEPDPMLAQFGQTQQPPFSSWEAIIQLLREEYEVRRVDLQSGTLAPDIDVLVLVAPQNLSDVERFAIDQFLMRGGALFVAASGFQPVADPFTGELSLSPTAGGIDELLNHYGVTIAPTLVLDPQNEPFPIAVTRDVGGFSVQEIQSLNYPYFVDIRSDGMNSESPMLGNLPAITLNWVSPVQTDAERTAGKEVLTLLASTPNAWTSADLNIQPDMERHPDQGFAIVGEPQTYPLAISMMGSFDSYFAGRPNPLQELEAAGGALPTIERSPATARLVVVGSAQFLNDTVFAISSQISIDRYLNSIRFVQNAIDWSVEDLDLLSIRARGSTTRLLRPLDTGEQTFWEVVNYGVSLTGLLIISLAWLNFRRNEEPMELVPREESSFGHAQQSHAVALSSTSDLRDSTPANPEVSAETVGEKESTDV